jgi:type VI secretion system secreted protein VgrG
VQFKSIVTPNPSAVFSPLVFSMIVNNFLAIDPQTVFQNPLKSIYATYTYDGMSDGVQWTEIWYFNGNLLKYKTISWDSGTGGPGVDVLNLPAEQWLPGTYQLVFFVGTEWKVLGEFRVVGTPPTATISPTPSQTDTPSMTPSVTHTLVSSSTPRPTDTRWPSPTQTK